MGTLLVGPSLMVAILAVSVGHASIVGNWRAEGNANDLSGNNNHGVLMNGASFGPGVAGQAFSFNGVDGFVEITGSTGLEIQDSPARTLALWLNWNGDQNKPTSRHYIWDSGTETGDGYFLILDEPSGASTGVRFGLRAPPVPTDIVSAPLPTPGVWTHYAVTYDGTTG